MSHQLPPAHPAHPARPVLKGSPAALEKGDLIKQHAELTLFSSPPNQQDEKEEAPLADN
jgi:hypothetical protein